MSSSVSPPGTASAGPVRIVRHAGIDRALHWLTAACVLTLLATAFLPILGLELDWVPVHWVTGCILIVLVVVHVVRALVWQDWRDVWIGGRDLGEAAGIVARTLRLSGGRVIRPGKYSFAQKLIHLAFAVVVISACVTGGLMLVKIDTPWWDRNPYWLADATWGIVYVVHDLAALTLISMVLCHVYFGLRPEKRQFLRAMIAGWITRDEYERHHDKSRWPVGGSETHE